MPAEFADLPVIAAGGKILKLASGVFALAGFCLFSAQASLPASYSYFLPESVRGVIAAEIAKLDLSEAGLAAREGAAFISEESKTSKQTVVRNRVHFFPGARFDIWFMSQHGDSHGAAPAMGDWNKLMIVVDKSATPKKSYYLEFGEAPLAARELPAPVAFTAACFTCHASGPRAIRMESTLSDGDATEAVVKKWNKEIAAYRSVETYFPPESSFAPSPPIRRTHALQREELKHKACTECHNSVDGVRAPLQRQHHYSILALTGHGHMPEEGPPLAEKEMRCLEAWLQGPDALARKKECNGYGEALGDFPLDSPKQGDDS